MPTTGARPASALGSGRLVARAPRVRVGAFPGSFNPPTVAHLAIAEAALDQCELDEVRLIVSRVALGKEDVQLPLLEHRLEVLRRVAQSRPWLGVDVTDVQLVADIAAGYDVLVLGADKWAQLLDPQFYDGSEEGRDAALARLPGVAVAPRPPPPVPAGAHVLAVPVHTAEASSTGVRQGRRDWMLPEAAEFDEDTGAWTDPDRYRTWLETAPPRTLKGN